MKTWDGVSAPAGRPVAATPGQHVYTPYTDVLGGRVAPLVPSLAGAPDGPLRIALVVPPFTYGSGGHHVLFAIAHALEERGHTVSSWVHDPNGLQPDAVGAELRHLIREQYAPINGPVFAGFDHWTGADIALATWWETAYAVLALPRLRARAYVVNDHEPEFYATSVEALLAARSYGLGLPCIVGGGPWLSTLLHDRYGVDVAGRFPYPVAPEFAHRPVPRRTDTLVVYGRNATLRRGVGLALIAMEELKRRRPDLRIVIFGDKQSPALNFAFEDHGQITPEQLAWVYSEATVGVAFSLTHGSLVPHDMMACGLPVVDLDGFGTSAEHAATGLVELAAPHPHAIADAVERLLDDPGLRERRSRAGLQYAATHTLAAATDAVEDSIRTIMRAPGPHVAE